MILIGFLFIVSTYALWRNRVYIASTAIWEMSKLAGKWRAMRGDPIPNDTLDWIDTDGNVVYTRWQASDTYLCNRGGYLYTGKGEVCTSRQLSECSLLGPTITYSSAGEKKIVDLSLSYDVRKWLIEGNELFSQGHILYLIRSLGGEPDPGRPCHLEAFDGNVKPLVVGGGEYIVVGKDDLIVTEDGYSSKNK